MTRPRRMPVSSFGPELLAVLVKGATEEFDIPFTTEKEMMALQLRLQTLRGAMARENHPDYKLVTRTRTSRRWDLDQDGKKYKFRLHIGPNDIQFAAAIEAAGVHVDRKHMEGILDDTPDATRPDDTILQPAVTEENPYAKFK